MSSRVEVLKEIIAEVAELNGTTSISMDSHLRNDLNISSLEALEVLLLAEERLGVKISEEALQGFTTFGDVVRWLESHGEG